MQAGASGKKENLLFSSHIQKLSRILESLALPVSEDNSDPNFCLVLDHLQSVLGTLVQVYMKIVNVPDLPALMEMPPVEMDVSLEGQGSATSPPLKKIMFL